MSSKLQKRIFFHGRTAQAIQILEKALAAYPSQSKIELKLGIIKGKDTQ